MVSLCGFDAARVINCEDYREIELRMISHGSAVITTGKQLHTSRAERIPLVGTVVAGADFGFGIGAGLLARLDR